MSLFDTVVFPRHKRNVFNLSHEFRTTLPFGKLVPVLCEEVLPGDTFQISTSNFIRAMPMLAPLMHRVNVYTHCFFVPNRLVWDNWKTFITGGEDGTEEPTFPTIRLYDEAAAIGSLADHLGVGVHNPKGGPYEATWNGIRVNALPFRAYNLIWNEYYRDQNLQEEIEISKDDGLDSITPANILTRNWQKDYFTSALPWTQRGPESQFNMNGVLDVNYTNNSGRPIIREFDDPDSTINEGLMATDANGHLINETDKNQVLIDPNGSLNVDLSEGVGITINQLRRSIALQKWMERNALGGSRYIEQIFAHFGVKSSDARLQRPEFLGGSIQPLSISEVLQTSASTENSDLGDMAGHGISAGTSKQFRRFFEEHGFVIGIVSIMPTTSYMDGTRRIFRKFDKFDYAFPEFANLGEQTVYGSEIYQYANENAIPQRPMNDKVFGYQSRFAEYKYRANTVHGDLRTDAFAPWTLVRSFGQAPVLNSDFVTADWHEEDLARIFPVTDSETQFVLQCFHQFKAIRMLPKHVIPEI